ncbi:DUF5954 family protein [Streptomyces sp. NPDC097727]|uniref:DUF5954 family protein n=1 Tax=Streptomyces sp. NPDC097727 TaxID=3366092 RepID=UPI0038300C56
MKQRGPTPRGRPARSPAHGLKEFLPLTEEVDEREAAGYARAADGFTKQVRPHEPEVRGRCFQIVRVERMMRIGPVGPKGPRRSDIDVQEPTRIHPAMDAVDEWGNVNSNEWRWARGNS